MIGALIDALTPPILASRSSLGVAIADRVAIAVVAPLTVAASIGGALIPAPARAYAFVGGIIPAFGPGYNGTRLGCHVTGAQGKLG